MSWVGGGGDYFWGLDGWMDKKMHSHYSGLF